MGMSYADERRERDLKEITDRLDRIEKNISFPRIVEAIDGLIVVIKQLNHTVYMEKMNITAKGKK